MRAATRKWAKRARAVISRKRSGDTIVKREKLAAAIKSILR